MPTNDNTLNIQIGAVIDGLDRALKEASGKIDKFAKENKKLGEEMERVGMSATKFLTVPILAAGGIAVAQAIKFEKLATSLDVLSGSAENGAKSFKRLEDFAAATPFQMEELVKVNNTLLGFGQSNDQAYESLKMLSDMASISGSDLQRLSIAFGQSAAMGRVMTMDLTQFVNNGVPVYKLLGDITGKTSGEIRQMAESGEISFELLNQAFRKATSEGGLFFKGTEKLSLTLGGRISTMTDNISLAMADFGKILGEAIGPLVQTVSDLAQGFRDLSPETKKIIIGVAGLLAVIGPVVTALGFFITTILPALSVGLAALSGPIGLIVLGLTAIGVVIYKNWEPIKKTLVDIANYFIDLYNESTIFRIAVQAVMLSFKNLWATVKLVFKNIWTVIVGVVEMIVNRFKFAGEIIKGALTFDWKAVKASFTNYAENAKGTFEKLTTGLKENFKETGKEIADNFTGALDGVAKRVKIILPKESVDATAVTKAVEEAVKLGGDPTRAKAVNIKTSTTGMGAVATKQSGLAATSPSIYIDDESIKAQEALLNFNNNLNNIISNEIANTLVGLGELLGEAMAGGGNILEKGGALLLASLGNVLTQVGTMAIQIGVGLIGIKKALSTLSGPVAIAAGVALVALGSFFSKKSKSIGASMGSGGSGGGGGTTSRDYNGTTAGTASRNYGGSTQQAGSYVDGGGTVVFEIAGTKLIGVLNRTLSKNQSLGGQLSIG